VDEVMRWVGSEEAGRRMRAGEQALALEAIPAGGMVLFFGDSHGNLVVMGGRVWQQHAEVSHGARPR